MVSLVGLGIGKYPAFVEYGDGVKLEIYSIKDIGYHRLDGPAWICYDKNGMILTEYYYINGKRIPTKIIEGIFNDLEIDSDYNKWTNEERLKFSFHLLSKE